MRSATSPRKKDPATETNTREPRNSVLRRQEGGPAGSRMTRSGEIPREATTPKLLETRMTINIATWNVRTMLETSRAAQIATEMQKNNIIVLGLCESRWPDSGQLTLTSGEKILYSWTRRSGPQTHWRSGHHAGEANPRGTHRMEAHFPAHHFSSIPEQGKERDFH